MSEQQLFFPIDLIERGSGPLLLQRAAHAEHLEERLRRQIAAAKEVNSWWEPFVAIFDVVEVALEGELWMPNSFRQCADRVHRMAEKQAREEFEMRIAKSIERRLLQLAECSQELIHETSREYFRRMAA